ncbi:MAG: M10 family metallopeptidase C-terminal domain-containing protein [Candidatus Phlomobacter fragariae]
MFSVWDEGGNDTLDFSGYFKHQMINLNLCSFSNVGGWTKNVSIVKDKVIENEIGSSGHDTIISNSVDNTTKGGAGDDVIYGGLGQDTLWGRDGTISQTKATNNSYSNLSSYQNYHTNN